MEPKIEKKANAAAETVTVTKEQWDTQNQRIEALTKSIEMLTSVADVSRVASYQSRNAASLTQHGRVSVIKDNVVVGWRMVEDFVGRNQNGVFVENQVIELTLDNNETVKMKYSDFAKIKKVKAEITGRNVIDGVEVLKITLEDGRKMEINVNYFN